MRVIGLNADGEGGCSYYRMLLPLAELDRRGHPAGISDTWVERPDCDVVVAQRIGWPHEADRWQALAEHAALVYEIDDDLFNVHPTNVRAYPMLRDPAVRRGMARCIAASDLVTVSTEPLAEVVREFNPNVAVLPNHVDQAMLALERPRRGRVTVGWSGGDSHLADLQVVAGHLRRFLDRNPSVDMHFVGADYSHLVRRSCRVTPFQRGVPNFYRVIDFDIGIAPLQPNIFNRSKSHIRALEYAALGIPVVASDEPAYRHMVVDGVTGFLVRYEHEWARRLRDLVCDEAMRAEMGAKAREHAAAWTIQAGWRRWVDAYQQLL